MKKVVFIVMSLSLQIFANVDKLQGKWELIGASDPEVQTNLDSAKAEGYVFLFNIQNNGLTIFSLNKGDESQIMSSAVCDFEEATSKLVCDSGEGKEYNTVTFISTTRISITEGTTNNVTTFDKR